MAITSKKVASNLVWRLMERFGAQGVSFVLSVILARLLDPEVYGTVALVTVFTTILQVFVDSGLGNSLIQKKDADDLDFSTVFFFNIFICAVLYLGMFLAAPLIASFYENPKLIPIIRVLSLVIVVSGVKNVQQAYVSRNMMFKRFFWATILSTIGSAILGITFAYLGLGVWALVGQTLFHQIVSTATLWITVKWRPKAMFSFERLKGLFSFGWKLLVSSLINTVYNDIRQLIIGKIYSSADLAYYNKGKQFPNLIITNINSSIDSVLLPTMSSAQDNPQQIKSLTRRSITMSTYIIIPMMVGLAVCAEPLISLLLTDKWLFCVPYLRIFCFTYSIYPMHTANLNAIKAMGRSDMFLKLEIIKKVIGLAAILVTMWHSVMAMALSLIVTTVISSFINAFPNKKLLNYSYFEQIKDILPAILLSAVMGVIVYCVSFLGLPEILTLFIQVPLGIVVYVAGSILTKNETYRYAINIIKGLFNKKTKEA